MVCDWSDLARVLGVEPARLMHYSKAVERELLAVLRDEAANRALRKFWLQQGYEDRLDLFASSETLHSSSEALALPALKLWYGMGTGYVLEGGTKWADPETETRWRRVVDGAKLGKDDCAAVGSVEGAAVGDVDGADEGAAEGTSVCGGGME